MYKLHNDYPLVSEKLEIARNMLSIYCSIVADKDDPKIGSASKLVPNLGNKSKCILHYRNFQQCLSLEMKLVLIAF